MTSRYPIFLVILYFVSRVMLYSYGVAFDDYSSTHIMQLPPFELLRSAPLETIWYMHMQPPVYAILFWLFGQDPYVFAIFYFVLGLLVSLAMYRILVGFEVSGFISYVMAGIFMLSPSFILFEHLMFYTFLCMCLLIFAVYFLQRKKLIWFSVMLMVLCMTRSMFHPLWMGVGLWVATTNYFKQ